MEAPAYAANYMGLSIKEQYDIMLHELTNCELLQKKGGMWENARIELIEADGSLKQSADALAGDWTDGAFDAFSETSLDIRRLLNDWLGLITGNNPFEALYDLSNQIMSTFGTVRDAYEQTLALTAARDQHEANLAILRAPAPFGADFDAGYAMGVALQEGSLLDQINAANTGIVEQHVRSSEAMGQLATAYEQTAGKLTAAASGQQFPDLGGGPAGGGGGGGGAPLGATARPGGGAVLPAGVALPDGTLLPDGLLPTDGVTLPEGATLPDGGTTLPGGATLPEGAGLPGGGGALPDGAALPGAGGAGLDQIAEPSLSGLGGALAPSLPPSLPPLTGGGLPPGTSPLTPYVPPVLPPVVTPGLPPGGNTGSRGSVPAVRPIGGGTGVGGAGVPGVSLGGSGSTSLPQAAVPVSAAQQAATGSPPVALGGATPAGTSTAGGAIPPIMPPMMGGAGAGTGGGGRPGSGAARRPPAGRGNGPSSTPGLPELLSGKAGRSEQGLIPVRTRRARPERKAEPPVAVQAQVVDEDLWRVDEATTRPRPSRAH
ncbi:hypothetical protein [Phytohabitans rumicis]|uniref:PPE family domain-containing protein n=1 Tax=Phytohabitans rumicis TaxID=1076125 RepID=A0A6V8LGJ1_9ACTN|nr:hypothetical protein [Phytohabitans rumicis]GFJ95374.1 hypothetical protein Prum_090160 [Phytohabitans rumicis]